MLIKQDDGTEVEMMTQAEVDAKIGAEKTAWEEGQKVVLLEKEGAITKLATEKSDLEKKIKDAELSGIKDDHPNFKILKEALATKSEDLNKLKTEIDADKQSRKKEALGTAVKEATKGNEELEKKVNLHLEKTLASLPENTPEERQVKLEAALKLSLDHNSQGLFDGGIGGGGFGGGGTGGDGSPKVEFTPRERALGAKFGITAEDYKKYGPKLTNKK